MKNWLFAVLFQSFLITLAGNFALILNTNTAFAETVSIAPDSNTLPVIVDNNSMKVSPQDSVTARVMAEVETVIALKKLQYTVTIPGDGLIRLANRFGLPKEDILKENPRLAARPDLWLYLRETLTIPVLVPQVKRVDEVADANIIAVSMGEIRANNEEVVEMKKEIIAMTEQLVNAKVGLTQAESKLAKTEAELRSVSIEAAGINARNSVLTAQVSGLKSELDKFFWMFIAAMVFFVIIGMLSIMKFGRPDLQKSQNAPQKPEDGLQPATATAMSKDSRAEGVLKELKEQVDGHPSNVEIKPTAGAPTADVPQKIMRPMSDDELKLLLKRVVGGMKAEDLLSLLQNAKGSEVLRLVGMPITYGGPGQPVMLKNITDFVKRRPHLNLQNYPLREWEEIVRADVAAKAKEVAAKASMGSTSVAA